MEPYTIVVIGGGLSGIVAAINIKNKYPDFNVIIIEKNNTIGGHLFQTYKNNFILNNGPSWYWFNDIIQKIFNDIGINEPLETELLDIQYKLIFKDNIINVPSNINGIKDIITKYDKLSINKFNTFITRNKSKYSLCKQFLEYKNLSVFEYLSLRLPYYLYKLQFFSSYNDIINTVSNNDYIRTLLKWPSLFIGTNPKDISGMFTFMTYTMCTSGTEIPKKKGMIDIINVLNNTLTKKNIKIITNHDFKQFNFNSNTISSISILNNNTNKPEIIHVDKLICSCDYNHIEKILPNKFRSYTKLFWDNQISCPSCITFNIVLNTKFPKLEFHNMFFESDIDTHMEYISKFNTIPKNPIFYVNITSKFFKHEVPNNCENMFILIPTPTKINLNLNDIKFLYQYIITRLSQFSDSDIDNSIVYTSFFSNIDFKHRFNAFHSNAYGLGCDNYQIGCFRPRIKSRYIDNLYYCGHLTHPGPGVPTCMLSGIISSNLLLEDLELEVERKIGNYYYNCFINCFYKFIMLINNLIINIVTLGINKFGKWTIWISFKKDFVYLVSNQLKEYNEYNI